MAQTAKAEGEEIKKLQLSKSQNEKTIGALQDDIKRTKQQLDFLKRESLKLRNENNDHQVYTVYLHQNKWESGLISR